MGFRNPEGGGTQFAEGDTARAEKQYVVERVTGAAANRAEPGIGKFPRREGFFGAGRLDVAFETEHPLPVLPIIAGLDTAHETGRLGRVVCDRTPGIADVGAEIGTGPAIGTVQRLGGCQRRARSVEVGRPCRHGPACSDQRQRAPHKPAHHATPRNYRDHAGRDTGLVTELHFFR